MSDNQANSGSATAERDPPPAQHVAQGAVDAPPPPAQKSMLWSIARNMAMYFALMFIIRNFTGLMTAPPAPTPAVIDGAGSPLRAAGAAVHSNAWRPGAKYDIYVWLSSIDIPSFDLMATPYTWRRTDLTYSDHTPDSEWSVNISRTSHPELWSNVTLYAHVVMLRDSLKPERAYLRPEEDTNYVVWPLVKRYPERLANDRKKLLSGEQVDEGGLEKRAVQKQGARALLPHWVPELNIRVIFDFATFQRGGIPPQLSRDLRLTHRGEYWPVIHVQEFFLTRASCIELNSSVAEVPLKITMSPQAAWKWQMAVTMDQSFRLHETWGTMNEGEGDEMKRIFVEGDPILLAITGCVSVLHTVFDMLSFKNDISFWKGVKSMQGLSVRSIFVSVFCQSVVFLYLMDNDTSWMVLFSSGSGLMIELWKMTKACSFTWTNGRLRMNHRSSYSGTLTQRYDDYAMKHLAGVLFPLAAGFALFSLVHKPHKSWYSWGLSALITFVQVFGFITLTPQLFINYKLKSVAALPWRAMTYKFLNTIIDDLFAFVVTMPTLYRIGVFRDDVVFLVYMYQRWVYRVDPNRTERGFAPAPTPQATAGADAVPQLSHASGHTADPAPEAEAVWG